MYAKSVVNLAAVGLAMLAVGCGAPQEANQSEGTAAQSKAPGGISLRPT